MVLVSELATQISRDKSAALRILRRWENDTGVKAVKKKRAQVSGQLRAGLEPADAQAFLLWWRSQFV
jgi:hypothetical protein